MRISHRQDASEYDREFGDNPLFARPVSPSALAEPPTASLAPDSNEEREEDYYLDLGVGD